MTTELSNPHDKFVREVWSREEVAWDFLCRYLPAALAGRLVPGSLRLRKDSFVDAALREHLSDLLYEVELQGIGRVLVYVLLEHKSYPDSWLEWQVLSYLVEIWRQERQQKKRRLTPVIPLVLYHGRRRWRMVPLRRLFAAADGLEDYIPTVRYELCDVGRLADEQLQGIVLLRLALRVLKYVFRPELNARLEELIGLLSELSDPRDGLAFLKTLLTYLSASAEHLDEGAVQQAIRKTFADQEGVVMATLAEKWMEQGFQRGVQQGVGLGQETNARESVLDVLETRFGTLPAELLQRLAEIHDIARLKHLHKTAIQTPDLESFLSELSE
jgi:predicted transposase/invertase (TIGR01784 family)